MNMKERSLSISETQEMLADFKIRKGDKTLYYMEVENGGYYATIVYLVEGYCFKFDYINWAFPEKREFKDNYSFELLQEYKAYEEEDF